MKSLLDIMLLSSVFMLVLLFKADLSDRKKIIFVFFLAQTIVAVRLITQSFVAVVLVVVFFLTFLMLRMFVFRKTKLFCDFVVALKDDEHRTVTLSDGCKTFQFMCDDVNIYHVGQIVRIKIDFLGNYI